MSFCLIVKFFVGGWVDPVGWVITGVSFCLWFRFAILEAVKESLMSVCFTGDMDLDATGVGCLEYPSLCWASVN